MEKTPEQPQVDIVARECECGGRPKIQKWGGSEKYWVCCDTRECDRETGTYHTRLRATQVWNNMQRSFIH